MRFLQLTLLILISLLSSPSVFADRWRSICENAQKVAAFTGQIKNIPWPGFLTTPTGAVVPTIVNATIMEESSLLTFCKLVMRIQKAEGLDYIYAARDVYNELQIEKYDATMRMIVETADLAQYGERRRSRRNQTFGVQDARAINSYLGNMNRIYNEDRKFEDQSLTFTSRRERERRMTEISRATSRMDQINERLACDNHEQRDDIPTEIATRINYLDRASINKERDVQGMYVNLVRMGTKFLSVEQHRGYTQDLINIVNFMYEPKPHKRTRSIEVEKRRESGDMITKRESEDYFLYRVDFSQTYYTDFEEKWGKIWNGYINKRMRSTLKHQFGDKKFEIEKEFHDYDYECRENVLRRKYHYQDPDINRKVKQDRENCLRNLSAKINQAGGLLMYNLKLLSDKLEELSEKQAELYSLRSEYMGMHFLRNESQSEYHDFKTVTTECYSSMSEAELVAARRDLKVENVRLRTIIAEDVSKESAIMEAEMNQKRRIEEEERARREIYRARRENTPSPRITPKPLDF